MIVSLDGIVCEISVMNTNGSVLFESLVYPECPVSDVAQDNHGIRDKELTAASPPLEILPTLQEVLLGQGSVIDT